MPPDVFSIVSSQAKKLYDEIKYDEDADKFFNSLSQWPESKTLTSALSDMAPLSLFSAIGLYMIYSYIRCAGPKLGLEIGSYHAGTTLGMAHAMYEIGDGKILTIDPFGAERVPPIIDSWPPELAARVKFAPHSSMQAFMAARHAKRRFDFVFVDGDHSFEFAFFDLMASAQLMKPGGILFVDNADQPGVWAALDAFLAQNPAWRPVGAARSRGDDEFPGWDYSFSQWPGVILQAPDRICIASVPYSVEGVTDLTEVGSVKLDLSRASGSGTLYAIVYLRAFYVVDPMPSERRAVASISMGNGDSGSRTLEFAAPMTLELRSDEDRRLWEVILIWRPDEASRGSSLVLDSAPELCPPTKAGVTSPVVAQEAGRLRN